MRAAQAHAERFKKDGCHDSADTWATVADELEAILEIGETKQHVKAVLSTEPQRLTPEEIIVGGKYEGLWHQRKTVRTVVADHNTDPRIPHDWVRYTTGKNGGNTCSRTTVCTLGTT